MSVVSPGPGGIKRTQSWPRIDVHTHAIPPTLPNFARKYGGSWPEIVATGPCRADLWVCGKRFRALDDRCWDAQARLGDMAAEDVAVQVVSPIPATFSYGLDAAGAAELARAQNTWIAELVREWPRSFVGLGSVPLQSPSLAAELTLECVRDLGLKGVEIGTNVNGLALDDPSLSDFYAACEEAAAVVFVHPWQVIGQERLGAHGLAFSIGMPAETAAAAATLILSGILDRHPDLRILLAHGGGALVPLIPRIERCVQMLPDLIPPKMPVRDYLARFWYDSLVYDSRTISRLVEAVGDRVMVGSDYPFAIGERPAGESIEGADLAESEAQAVFFGTAAALFDIHL